MGVVIGFSVRIDEILREFATGLLNSLQTRVPWFSRKITEQLKEHKWCEEK
jgi:hypothetical protein